MGVCGRGEGRRQGMLLIHHNFLWAYCLAFDFTHPYTCHTSHQCCRHSTWRIQARHMFEQLMAHGKVNRKQSFRQEVDRSFLPQTQRLHQMPRLNALWLDIGRAHVPLLPSHLHHLGAESRGGYQSKRSGDLSTHLNIG